MRAGEFYKQDRVTRLMRILALFQARRHGLTTREIAGRLEVSQRTIQRDLVHLQAELHVPFVLVGTRWNVPGEFFLLPLTFNIHEAMAMLINGRLMLRFADKANLFATSAYEKVAAALAHRPRILSWRQPTRSRHVGRIRSIWRYSRGSLRPGLSAARW